MRADAGSSNRRRLACLSFGSAVLRITGTIGGGPRQQARGKQRGIFRLRQVGEHDVRALALQIADETERARERGAAQQIDAGRGKLANQAGDERGQSRDRGALRPPERAVRHAGPLSPEPFAAPAQHDQPRLVGHLPGIGDRGFERHDVHPVAAPEQPACGSQHRTLRAAAAEARDQHRDMGHDAVTTRRETANSRSSQAAWREWANSIGILPV